MIVNLDEAGMDQVTMQYIGEFKSCNEDHPNCPKKFIGVYLKCAINARKCLSSKIQALKHLIFGEPGFKPPGQIIGLLGHQKLTPSFSHWDSDFVGYVHQSNKSSLVLNLYHNGSRASIAFNVQSGTKLVCLDPAEDQGWLTTFKLMILFKTGDMLVPTESRQSIALESVANSAYSSADQGYADGKLPVSQTENSVSDYNTEKFDLEKDENRDPEARPNQSETRDLRPTESVPLRQDSSPHCEITRGMADSITFRSMHNKT